MQASENVKDALADKNISSFLNYEEYPTIAWSSLYKRTKEMIKTRVQKSPLPLVILLMCNPEQAPLNKLDSHQLMRLILDEPERIHSAENDIFSLKFNNSLSLEYITNNIDLIVKMHFNVLNIEPGNFISSSNFLFPTEDILLNEWASVNADDSENPSSDHTGSERGKESDLFNQNWNHDFAATSGDVESTVNEITSFQSPKYSWFCPLCKFKSFGNVDLLTPQLTVHVRCHLELRMCITCYTVLPLTNLTQHKCKYLKLIRPSTLINSPRLTMGSSIFLSPVVSTSHRSQSSNFIKCNNSLESMKISSTNLPVEMDLNLISPNRALFDTSPLADSVQKPVYELGSISNSSEDSFEISQHQTVAKSCVSPPILIAKANNARSCKNQSMTSSLASSRSVKSQRPENYAISVHLDDDLVTLEELASIEVSKDSPHSQNSANLDSTRTSPALSMSSDRLSMLETQFSTINGDKQSEYHKKRNCFSQGVICEDCPNSKIFFDSFKYHQHRKNKHSNVVFNCDQCNRAFSTKGNLNKHFEQVHNKCHIQVCPHCDERLANKRHIAAKHQGSKKSNPVSLSSISADQCPLYTKVVPSSIVSSLVEANPIESSSPGYYVCLMKKPESKKLKESP